MFFCRVLQDGKTPLDWAVGNTEMVQFLRPLFFFSSALAAYRADEASLAKLKVADLKDILTSKSKKVSGNKGVLLKRVREVFAGVDDDDEEG